MLYVKGQACRSAGVGVKRYNIEGQHTSRELTRFDIEFNFVSIAGVVNTLWALWDEKTTQVMFMFSEIVKMCMCWKTLEN